ncbi:MAG: hypothetical protein LBL15_07480 [Oscillospiraceae bacterium]|jgi:hypothetical protein|nr:hypothetical protein [Oscillospiraceae bacterium]
MAAGLSIETIPPPSSIAPSAASGAVLSQQAVSKKQEQAENQRVKYGEPKPDAGDKACGEQPEHNGFKHFSFPPYEKLMENILSPPGEMSTASRGFSAAALKNRGRGLDRSTARL